MRASEFLLLRKRKIYYWRTSLVSDTNDHKRHDFVLINHDISRVAASKKGPLSLCPFLNLPPRHGKIEFDMVTGIVPSTGQIHAHVLAVLHTRVASPVDAVVLRQFSRPLRFVEKQRQLHHVAVVVNFVPLGRSGGRDMVGFGRKKERFLHPHGQTLGARRVHQGLCVFWNGSTVLPGC